MRALLLAAMLLLAALAGFIHGAPAPPQRAPKVKPQPPAPAFVGQWKMTWRGAGFRATFGADGSYNDGGCYAGTWCFDDFHRILYVEELGMHGGVNNWSVTLSGPRCGTLCDGSDWLLEELP